MKAYDGRFKDLFEEVFEAEFADKFRDAGITYEHRLIDDMVACALKWDGGFVWACKNYDGDVQSDTVAQGFGSLGLMTSVLMTPDGRRSRRKAHMAPSLAIIASTSRARKPRPTRSPRSSWTRGLSYRAKFDDTPDVAEFADDPREGLHPDRRTRPDDQGPRPSHLRRAAVPDD